MWYFFLVLDQKLGRKNHEIWLYALS